MNGKYKSSEQSDINTNVNNATETHVEQDAVSHCFPLGWKNEYTLQNDVPSKSYFNDIGFNSSITHNFGSNNDLGTCNEPLKYNSDTSDEPSNFGSRTSNESVKCDAAKNIGGDNKLLKPKSMDDTVANQKGSIEEPSTDESSYPVLEKLKNNSDEVKDAIVVNAAANVQPNGSESSVASQYDMKAHASSKYIVGQNYKVSKGYKKLDEGEISVSPGDSVEILVNDKDWLKVKLMKNNSVGLVPISYIGKLIEADHRAEHHSSAISIYDWIKKNVTSYIIPFSIIMIACLYYYFFMNGKPTPSEMIHLKKKYPDIPDNLWITLEYCLKMTSEDIPCILMVLNGGDENLEHLLRSLGDFSVKHLNTVQQEPIAKLIELRSNSLGRADSFFTDLKFKLNRDRVLIAYDTEKIPADIMRKFHAFCDIHDPAVKGPVLIFMLNHKDIDVEYKRNDATYAIDILDKLWEGSIHKDIIAPLAIRITENVVNLRK